jgi:hypothetical protein
MLKVIDIFMKYIIKTYEILLLHLLTGKPNSLLHSWQAYYNH